VGGPRAATYAATANDVVAVIPMVETVDALHNLDGILSVPGIDAVYVGPADLSLSLGLRPGNNDDSPSFREALERVVAACRRHGVIAGIHSTGALTGRRLEQGFSMVTVTSDVVALRSGLVAEMAHVREHGQATGRDSLY
jgi:4-hydroxy-2-oxoheptanedioate aldolase